jgi:Uma2 family endonuclease
MANTTKQFRWIVAIKENLELLFAERANVFVAGQLRWHPLEHDSTVYIAPDVMVVQNRPKREREAYKQWDEEQIPPRVIFGIRSPYDTVCTLAQNLDFYDRYGVEEYYLIDPDRFRLTGWQRKHDGLVVIEKIQNWISPNLNIRFELGIKDLKIYAAMNQPFLTYGELVQLKEKTEQRLLQTHQALNEVEQFLSQCEQRVRTAEQSVQQEQERAMQAEARVVQLEAKLKALGHIPDA